MRIMDGTTKKGNCGFEEKKPEVEQKINEETKKAVNAVKKFFKI